MVSVHREPRRVREFQRISCAGATGEEPVSSDSGAGRGYEQIATTRAPRPSFRPTGLVPLAFVSSAGFHRAEAYRPGPASRDGRPERSARPRHTADSLSLGSLPAGSNRAVIPTAAHANMDNRFATSAVVRYAGTASGGSCSPLRSGNPGAGVAPAAARTRWAHRRRQGGREP